MGALGAEDYVTIAEQIGGRVFFAGEATNPRYPATMHGAYESGIRQVFEQSLHPLLPMTYLYGMMLLPKCCLSSSCSLADCTFLVCGSCTRVGCFRRQTMY